MYGFKVGDFVECVDVFELLDTDITEGCIYEVVGVDEEAGPDAYGQLISLRGIEPEYFQWRFRLKNSN